MPNRPNPFDHLSHSNGQDHQPVATPLLGPASFPPGLFSATTPATIADLHSNFGPWWARRDWSRYLQDLLLYRSRRRYTLSVSDGADQPLGATDPHTKQVHVNPTAIAYPDDPAQRQRIRHIPTSIVPFQQAITVALVEHEAGHIRHSGEKPAPTLLAWLWNALEDERQERLQTAENPELADLFAFLGDAVWHHDAPATDLLAGCLLWRWEHDRLPPQRKFRPASLAMQSIWDQQICPLVEQAWAASTSDDVTTLARTILHRLHLPDVQPLPRDLPESLCHCGSGEAGPGTGHTSGTPLGSVRHDGPTDRNGHNDATKQGDAPSAPTQAPVPPPGATIPGRLRMGGGGAGRGQGHSPSDPAQADPTALVAEVEPYAATLARLLRPPEVYAGRRPHHSRGDLDVERALGSADRLFEARLAQAPKPSEAWFILIDVSASMQSAHRPATAMAGALRAAMWLVVAAERARIADGVGAFDDQPTMIRIRDLAIGSDVLGDQRLAGLDHGGGTRLAPALEQASRTLTHYQAHRKLLVVLHDGDLESADAQATRHLVATLPKRGIHLLPLYLGSDPAVIAANRRVFGDLLACPDLGSLTSLLLSWLRARAS